MTQLICKHEIINKEARNKLFSSISTPLDSYVLIEHLTNISISTILYLRKLLPNTEFENNIFKGMTLKTLKQDTGHLGTQRIQKWLAGAFDAIKKKYLKNILLEVKDTWKNLTLELYTISIGYDTKSDWLSVSTTLKDSKEHTFRNSKENDSDIESQIVQFLHMCYTITKSCSELPNEVSVCMKLSYQKNAPDNYQPFGFVACGPIMPVFAKNTKNIEIGAIITNYHSIELVNKTCLIDEKWLPKNLSEPNQGKDSSLIFSGCKEKHLILNRNSCDALVYSDTFSEISNKVVDDKYSGEISSQCTDEGSQSSMVRCPCLSQVKTSVMYQCSGCNYWVHANCFGISLDNKLVQINVFYCQICHNVGKNFSCHDEIMTNLERASDQQKLAIQRRLLSFCNRDPKREISFRKLEKVSGLPCHQEFLHIVLKEMIEWGVLILQSGCNSYTINKDKLIQKMQQFFYPRSKFENKDLPSNNKEPKAEEKTPQLGKRKLERSSKFNKKILITEQNPKHIKNL